MEGGLVGRRVGARVHGGCVRQWPWRRRRWRMRGLRGCGSAGWRRGDQWEVGRLSVNCELGTVGRRHAIGVVVMLLLDCVLLLLGGILRAQYLLVATTVTARHSDWTPLCSSRSTTIGATWPVGAQSELRVRRLLRLDT